MLWHGALDWNQESKGEGQFKGKNAMHERKNIVGILDQQYTFGYTELTHGRRVNYTEICASSKEQQHNTYHIAFHIFVSE